MGVVSSHTKEALIPMDMQPVRKDFIAEIVPFLYNYFLFT